MILFEFALLGNKIFNYKVVWDEYEMGLSYCNYFTYCLKLNLILFKVLELELSRDENELIQSSILGTVIFKFFIEKNKNILF